MKSITIIVILRTTYASPVGLLNYKAKNVRKCLKIPQPTLQFNKRQDLFPLDPGKRSIRRSGYLGSYGSIVTRDLYGLELR